MVIRYRKFLTICEELKTLSRFIVKIKQFIQGIQKTYFWRQIFEVQIWLDFDDVYIFNYASFWKTDCWIVKMMNWSIGVPFI